MTRRPLAAAFVALSAAALSTTLLGGAAPAQTIPAYITAAVADKSRPAADVARDAVRKPAESVAFAGVKPGDKVADFIAGGGYFTRVLSKVVGPQGHVYATVPEAFATMRPAAADGLKAIAADPAYSNVTVLIQPPAKFNVPESLDVVWTAQNYHDLHNPGPFSANGDMAGFNKKVFDSLKPGGVFLVIDYASAPGAGFTQTASLHRGDEEAEKAEILKAGFVFDGESKALSVPGDPHTTRSHDKDDQFMLRFRKPR